MSGTWPEDLVAVAEILSPQGTRGEVKALPLTSSLDRFDKLRSVTALKGGTRRMLSLVGWRPWREFVMLTFVEIVDIDAAESIRGARICVPLAERAVLPAGRYYLDDLVGLKVTTSTGQDLGNIASVMATGLTMSLCKSPTGVNCSCRP